jgi:hypothetical protein
VQSLPHSSAFAGLAVSDLEPRLHHVTPWPRIADILESCAGNRTDGSLLSSCVVGLHPSTTEWDGAGGFRRCR